MRILVRLEINTKSGSEVIILSQISGKDFISGSGMMTPFLLARRTKSKSVP